MSNTDTPRISSPSTGATPETLLEVLATLEDGVDVDVVFSDGDIVRGLLSTDEDGERYVKNGDGYSRLLTCFGAPSTYVVRLDLIEYVYTLTDKGRALVSPDLEDIATPEAAKDTTLTPDDYQKSALDTAIYPGRGTFWGLQYATTGLGNESGEVQGVVKKMQRDKNYIPGDTVIDGAERDQLLDELGDVLWYLAVAAHEADLTLSQVMAHNVAKLAKRKAANTINANNR